MTLEELKNLIIFHCLDAPAWAKYAAVDMSGMLFIYSIKPKLSPAQDLKEIWSMPDDADVNHDEYHDIHQFKQNVIDLWQDSLVELT